MPIRRVTVQQPGKHAIGHDAGHVAELDQPVQAQLPHADEVRVGKRRPHHHAGQQFEAAAGKPAERRQADKRGIRADVGVELRADPRDLLVHLDGRP